MATVMNLGDIIRIRTFQQETVASQIGINTTFWRVSAITLDPTIEDMLADFGTRIAPFYLPLMGANARYALTGAARMHQPNETTQETSEVYDVSGAAFGTGAGNQVPLQVSYVIALKTGFATRHARGRIYPAFPPASFATIDGLMTAGAQVSLQQLAEFYQSAQTFPLAAGRSVTIQCVVRGVTAPGELQIVNYRTVTSAIGRSRFGTQRRRGQYGRLNQLPA